MKTIAALLFVGLLGVLAGSLAAQPPSNDRVAAPPRGVIYEGPVEVQMVGAGDPMRGTARIYEGWVALDDQRQLIPRDQIRRIMLGEPGRFDDFGDQPEADPNAVPDPNPNTPPKRRPFRED